MSVFFSRCEAWKIRYLPAAIINQPSVCLSLPPSLTRQYPSALFTKVRRRNIRKPPWSRVREKEGKKGRIRLIFQLGIETTNRRSLVTVCCPREGAEIDARRPCVTLKEGREGSVDRSFVSLSVSVECRTRERTLGIFCQMPESKRGAAGDISRETAAYDEAAQCSPLART